MARSRRGSHPVSARRLTAWDEGPGDSATDTLTGSGNSVLGSGAQPVVEGLTLVRVRGHFGLTLNAATAVGDGYTGALGICLVTNSAFAAGITSLPTPLTELSWDGWLYHTFFDIRAGLDVALQSNITRQIEVDSKAMRKVPVDMTIAAILEVVEQGTAQIEVTFNSRILVKLP